MQIIWTVMVFQSILGGNPSKIIEKLKKIKNPDFGVSQIIFTCSIQKLRSIASKLKDYFQKNFSETMLFWLYEILHFRTVFDSNLGFRWRIFGDFLIFSKCCQLWGAVIFFCTEPIFFKKYFFKSNRSESFISAILVA